MAKKILSITLAILMMFTALPMMFASAAEEVVATTAAAEPVVIVAKDEAAKVVPAAFMALVVKETEALTLADIEAVLDTLFTEGTEYTVTITDFVAAVPAVEATPATTDAAGETVEEATEGTPAVPGSCKFTVVVKDATDTVTSDEITLPISTVEKVSAFVAFFQDLFMKIKQFFMALDFLTFIF